jgi:hypothetical protein
MIAVVPVAFFCSLCLFVADEGRTSKWRNSEQQFELLDGV